MSRSRRNNRTELDETVLDGAKRKATVKIKIAVSDKENKAVSDKANKAISDKANKAISERANKAISDKANKAISDKNYRALSDGTKSNEMHVLTQSVGGLNLRHVGKQNELNKPLNKASLMQIMSSTPNKKHNEITKLLLTNQKQDCIPLITQIIPLLTPSPSLNYTRLTHVLLLLLIKHPHSPSLAWLHGNSFGFIHSCCTLLVEYSSNHILSLNPTTNHDIVLLLKVFEFKSCFSHEKILILRGILSLCNQSTKESCNNSINLSTNSSININQQSIDLLSQLLLSLHLSIHPSESSFNLESIISDNEIISSILYNHAGTRLQVKEYNDAIFFLSLSCKSGMGLGKRYEGLGDCFNGLKEYSSAIDWFIKAISKCYSERIYKKIIVLMLKLNLYTPLHKILSTQTQLLEYNMLQSLNAPLPFLIQLLDSWDSVDSLLEKSLLLHANDETLNAIGCMDCISVDSCSVEQEFTYNVYHGIYCNEIGRECNGFDNAVNLLANIGIDTRKVLLSLIQYTGKIKWNIFKRIQLMQHHLLLNKDDDMWKELAVAWISVCELKQASHCIRDKNSIIYAFYLSFVDVDESMRVFSRIQQEDSVEYKYFKALVTQNKTRSIQLLVECVKSSDSKYLLDSVQYLIKYNIGLDKKYEADKYIKLAKRLIKQLHCRGTVDVLECVYGITFNKPVSFTLDRRDNFDLMDIYNLISLHTLFHFNRGEFSHGFIDDFINLIDYYKDEIERIIDKSSLDASITSKISATKNSKTCTTTKCKACTTLNSNTINSLLFKINYSSILLNSRSNLNSCLNLLDKVKSLDSLYYYTLGILKLSQLNSIFCNSVTLSLLQSTPLTSPGPFTHVSLLSSLRDGCNGIINVLALAYKAFPCYTWSWLVDVLFLKECLFASRPVSSLACDVLGYVIESGFKNEYLDLYSVDDDFNYGAIADEIKEFVNKSITDIVTHAEPNIQNDTVTQLIPDNPADTGIKKSITLKNDYIFISINADVNKDILYLTRHYKDNPPYVARLPLQRHDTPTLSIKDVVREFDDIISQSDESLARAGEYTDKRSAWWGLRRKLDKRLELLLQTLAKDWIGGFNGLFETCVVGQEFSDKLHGILRSFGCGMQVPDQLCHLLFNSLDLSDLLSYLLYCNRLNGCPDFDLDQVKNLICSLHSSSLETPHIVLILDSTLTPLPWESLSFLRKKSVSRALSMFHSGCFSSETLVSKDKVSYVLNPAKDLASTQALFEKLLKPSWTGFVATPPSQQEYLKLLEEYNVFLYFGHGGGQQFTRGRVIPHLSHCAVAFLFGCSSVSVVHEYMLAGCSALVGNLWDVTDRDLDRFALALLDRVGITGDGDMGLCESVAEARDACCLKYLVGGAPVVYGQPVKFE